MILYHDFETRSEVDLNVVELDNYLKHPSTRALMLSWAIDDEPTRLWFPDKEKIPQELKLALLTPSCIKIAWNASFERGVWKHVMPRHGYDCFDIPYEEWADPSVLARSLSMPGKLAEVGEVLGLPEDQAKKKEGRTLIRLFSIPMKIKKKRKKADWEKFFGEDIPAPSFNDEASHPAEWATFCQYCVRDTDAERTIWKMLSSLSLSEFDRRGWILDQQINDRGIPTNRQFCKNALEMGLKDQAIQQEKMKVLTGLENPNSIQQLLPWVKERGYPYDSLLKKLVDSVLKHENKDVKPEAREALRLRLESGKNSFKKFETILEQLSSDDRLRRQFVYLGAARSGRWSGQGAQVQNLPRPSIKNVELAMELIAAMDFEAAQKAFPSVIDAVSSCVRSAFQAGPGKTLVVADLNAIENRVLGWVCNEPKIQKVFDDGLDPYLAFAALRYKVPYEELKADYDGYKKALKEKREPTAKQQDAADKRQIMKPYVLGAGYGLGGGALQKNHKTGEMQKTGAWGYAASMGVQTTQEESRLAVAAFRAEYSGVPKFWAEIEKACIRAIVDGVTTQVGVVTVSCIRRKNGQKIMRIKLPSGRYLNYLNAHIAEVRSQVREFEKDGKTKRYISAKCSECRTRNSFHEFRKDGKRNSVFAELIADKPITNYCHVCDGDTEWKAYEERIAYDGIGHGVAAVEDVTGWGLVYTYGGKLTENIVQAISRDILLHAMLLVSKVMDIILHVHDEIGCEVPVEKAKEMLEFLVKCMSTTPDSCPGLKLGAEGYISPFYKKG